VCYPQNYVPIATSIPFSLWAEDLPPQKRPTCHRSEHSSSHPILALSQWSIHIKHIEEDMAGSNPKLTAAILIVSETASQDPASDRSAATLTSSFAEDSTTGWGVPATKIVRDDVLEIQRAVTGWTDGEDFANLVVTTGGTGFAVKDVTPEVSE
jgi:hypothetical protein